MNMNQFKDAGLIDHRKKKGKRGRWELQVLWGTGEVTWEPLSDVEKDDPIACARYGDENCLLNVNGWKHLRKVNQGDTTDTERGCGADEGLKRRAKESSKTMVTPKRLTQDLIMGSEHIVNNDVQLNFDVSSEEDEESRAEESSKTMVTPERVAEDLVAEGQGMMNDDVQPDSGLSSDDGEEKRAKIAPKTMVTLEWTEDNLVEEIKDTTGDDIPYQFKICCNESREFRAEESSKAMKMTEQAQDDTSLKVHGAIGDEPLHVFLNIIGHRKKRGRPLSTASASPCWEINLLWRPGEDTWQPLSDVEETDPVSCARYGDENGLLNISGWEHLRKVLHDDTSDAGRGWSTDEDEESRAEESSKMMVTPERVIEELIVEDKDTGIDDAQLDSGLSSDDCEDSCSEESSKAMESTKQTAIIEDMKKRPFYWKEEKLQDARLDGWSLHLCKRPKDNRVDKYWITPTGLELSSKFAVNAFLEALVDTNGEEALAYWTIQTPDDLVENLVAEVEGTGIDDVQFDCDISSDDGKDSCSEESSKAMESMEQTAVIEDMKKYPYYWKEEKLQDARLDGWSLHLCKRPKGNRVDKYWITPTGLKLSSIVSVDGFLEALVYTNGDEMLAYQRCGEQRSMQHKSNSKAPPKRKSAAGLKWGQEYCGDDRVIRQKLHIPGSTTQLKLTEAHGDEDLIYQRMGRKRPSEQKTKAPPKKKATSTKFRKAVSPTSQPNLNQEQEQEQTETTQSATSKVVKVQDTNGDEPLYNFEKIINHRKGKRKHAWDLLILWSNGEQTWEPLKNIKETDSSSCASYGKENDLLHLNGWKRLLKKDVSPIKRNPEGKTTPTTSAFNECNDDLRLSDRQKGGMKLGDQRVSKLSLEPIGTVPEENSLIAYLLGARNMEIEYDINDDVKSNIYEGNEKFELISTKLIKAEKTGQFNQAENSKIQCAYLHTTGLGLKAESPSNLLNTIAGFSSLSARKAVARLELLQSPASKDKRGKFCIKSFLDSYVEDIPENGHEGCGFICETLLLELMENHANSARVCCIQVRLFIPRKGIYKGMLMKKKIETGAKIQLPGSMKKVPASAQTGALEIAYLVICQAGVDPSKNSGLIGRLPSLNPNKDRPPDSFSPKPLKDIILRLFEALGVPKRECEQYRKRSIRKIGAKRTIRKNGAGKHIGKVLPLPAICHCYLRGVADSTDKIPPNTVFITGISDAPDFPETVFITRCPCIKADDGRKIKVLRKKPRSMSKVEYKWLCELPFGIVIFGFPKPGYRAAPPMIANGDLDGDRYFCCWDKTILRHIDAKLVKNEPIPRARPVHAQLQDVSEAVPEDENWFPNVQLAMISNTMELRSCDKLKKLFYKLSGKAADNDSANFLRNKDAEAFADAFYLALDFAKHGKKIELPNHLFKDIPKELHYCLTPK